MEENNPKESVIDAIKYLVDKAANERGGPIIWEMGAVFDKYFRHLHVSDKVIPAKIEGMYDEFIGGCEAFKAANKGNPSAENACDKMMKHVESMHGRIRK